eukprot:gnl/Dysnectes_brevis/1496_a1694_2787.p1 GENE.gnl/Dysnectes_brevis/1496_a1694_2787~~gnl/Dysnectes_brevis/1496_a1694_2787.p1  ORF type:complete len:214 (-),score=48.00 gnl/Dysnectes_brevis/1496_a1694_2787:152-793(-)
MSAYDIEQHLAIYGSLPGHRGVNPTDQGKTMKRMKKKRKDVVIKFDPEARKEWVTGYQKRKNIRRARFAEMREKKVHDEYIEKRTELRVTRNAGLPDLTPARLAKLPVSELKRRILALEDEEAADVAGTGTKLSTAQKKGLLRRPRGGRKRNKNKKKLAFKKREGQAKPSDEQAEPQKAKVPTKREFETHDGRRLVVETSEMKMDETVIGRRK